VLVALPYANHVTVALGAARAPLAAALALARVRTAGGIYVGARVWPCTRMSWGAVGDAAVSRDCHRETLFDGHENAVALHGAALARSPRRDVRRQAHASLRAYPFLLRVYACSTSRTQNLPPTPLPTALANR
jgi:hypothetical protein